MINIFCLECNNLIIKEITYLNIFKPNIHKICDNCFESNIFIQRLEVIPIKNYITELHTLFEKKMNTFALMSFLKPYFEYYLKNRHNFIILFFDTLDINIYNIIKNIELGDIYLITLCNKI